MEEILLSLNSMEDVIKIELGIVGSLIIFAAVGALAYSASINLDHPIDPIILKFKNVRRFFLSITFHCFAIINFVSVLIIFLSILLKCGQFEKIPHVIPFIILSSGVWFITFMAARDFLWKIGR